MDAPPLQTDLGLVRVRRAAPEEVVDLRHAVLRAGLPRDSAIFCGDEHPDARHVIAATAGGRVVGCATAHASTLDGRPAWHVRGMATDPAVRGAGVGRQMLAELEEVLRDGVASRPMWCNARVPAIGFYERLGWERVSDVFDIPTAGPHVEMVRTERG